MIFINFEIALNLLGQFQNFQSCTRVIFPKSPSQTCDYQYEFVPILSAFKESSGDFTWTVMFFQKNCLKTEKKRETQWHFRTWKTIEEYFRKTALSHFITCSSLYQCCQCAAVFRVLGRAGTKRGISTKWVNRDVLENNCYEIYQKIYRKRFVKEFYFLKVFVDIFFVDLLFLKILTWKD